MSVLYSLTHQVDSTFTDRQSTVVPGKPLFLKELSRLWAKLEGEHLRLAL